LPLAAITVTVAVATANPVVSALMLASAAMFAALGVAPAWTLCVDIGGPHAGVVTGAMNMCGNLGGALVSLVVGFCVKHLHSYDAAMYSMAGMYLFSGACWAFVDPSVTLSETDPRRPVPA
jgi:ACS family glucarate transporter-like MFS transporter